MARPKPRSAPRPSGAAGAAERQRRVSRGLAGAGRSVAPGAARRRSGRPVPAATAVLDRPRRGERARVRPAGLLLRFIACGLVSLAAGLAWFLTHRDSRLSPAGALFGVVLLLSGFLVGGALWYVRDARLRSRDPKRMDDEAIVFSFTVFVLVPLAVLALVVVVWLVALVVHA